MGIGKSGVWNLELVKVKLTMFGSDFEIFADEDVVERLVAFASDREERFLKLERELRRFKVDLDLSGSISVGDPS